MEKVVILGNGVAGLTAAIYAGRAGLKPLVISGYSPGGQLMITTTVENFPGFPDGILGPQLVQNMQKQAEKFGAQIITESAKSVEIKNNIIELETDKQKIETQSLIIATGAKARWLNLPSEEQFRSKGVHTCATCDGFFYKDKEIMIVGGGDVACEEADFLTKFASKVTMVHRRDELRASKIMQDRVLNNPKIEMMWDSIIEEYKGDKALESVAIKNVKTNEIKEYPISGVFLAIGHDPATEILKGVIELDKNGFIITDKKMKTSAPGIFAAGDVQDPSIKQAVTAAGSGCTAAIEAERYVENS